MNAVQIIQAVRALGGDIYMRDGRLFASTPNGLPERLRDDIASHKAAIMIALGCPIDQVMATVLEDLRPHLPEGLRRLPDDRLLILVNWTIMVGLSRVAGRVRAALPL